jgi:hypothetical protein
MVYGVLVVNSKTGGNYGYILDKQLKLKKKTQKKSKNPLILRNTT